MEMLVIMEGRLRRRPGRLLLRNCGARRCAFGEAPHEDVATWDVRRAVGVAPLELARRLAHDRSEARAERAEAREPHREAHLGHREVRRAQQVLCALDATA